ncbi:hypothetical protein Salat_1881600 [Sesamum alatum]|uniref:Reverse transcriptase zinc-binding domain-containing protein n=1 Tax=Sesamum alatum TaxID=300844 RepID=A0AAE2CI56_9LAMI|nr:hypothetical protein Salat_1881600 [Sesamum alatum]
MRVSDLIDKEQCCWDLNKVRACLEQEDAKMVLSIPLPTGNVADKLIWHFNSNDKFSVKSAHHLALNLSSKEQASSSKMDSGLSWKFLWDRQIPPKMKTFGWKLCRGALPLMHNLAKKQVAVMDTCPVCKADNETEHHLFLTCSFAWQVWALTNIPWSVISEWRSDAED